MQRISQSYQAISSASPQSKADSHYLPRRACFAGEYEEYPIKDIYPSVEDTSTIFPFLFSRTICLAAACSLFATCHVLVRDLKELNDRLTNAVHACIQYPFVIPRERSSGCISRRYIGFAAPAHAKTASGTLPPWASLAAWRAAADSSAVSREKEKALNTWFGLWRLACVRRSERTEGFISDTNLKLF